MDLETTTANKLGSLTVCSPLAPDRASDPNGRIVEPTRKDGHCPSDTSSQRLSFHRAPRCRLETQRSSLAGTGPDRYFRDRERRKASPESPQAISHSMPFEGRVKGRSLIHKPRGDGGTGRDYSGDEAQSHDRMVAYPGAGASWTGE
jgi:hypothetical protein